MHGMQPSHVFLRPKAPPSRSHTRHSFRWFSLLLLVVLLSADLLSEWATATPVHAASTNTTQTNPTIKPPSWLTPTTSVKAPDLGQYVAPAKAASPQVTGGQHTWPVPMKPARIQVTDAAQHFVSSDGQLLVDIATKSLDSTQISQAKGGIWLYISQIKPGSGGLSGSQVTFGTYELAWFDGSGKPLNTVKLQHPLTVHFHMRKDQSGLVVKGQQVYAVWNAVQGATAAPTVTAQATTQGAQTAVEPQVLKNQKPILSYAHSDSSGLDWSVQSSLAVPVSTTSKTAQSQAQSTAAVPSVQASSVAFNTSAPQATWGNPTDFQVGLNSGGLTYNYPLNVPPGPGGLQPSLALNYSSGSVDENYGWQSASPWVGQGWNLDMGSISWAQENVDPNNANPEIENVWHINDPSGIGGQLIPPDQTYTTVGTLKPNLSQLQNNSNQYIWHSAPESHAKIREVAFGSYPCWQVYLPNGSREDFGCTNDSREAYQDGSGAWDMYKWNLDLMIDRYGNQVHVSYNQVFPSGYVRDAAIADITYDDPTCHNTGGACSSWNPLVDIHFDANQSVAHLLNGGCGGGTSTARCDDPQDLSGSGGLPAPKVMSAYVLNDVQVKVQSNLLHEYVFSYNQSGPGTQTDPNTGLNESFAGHMTLGKIQEEGTNGTSLNAPVVTINYGEQWEHYADTFSYSANNGTICSPYSAAPRDGSSTAPCFLWSQTMSSFYITNLDNGRGWHESVSWKEAHSNTWGVDSGAVNDALNCYTNGQTSTNLCGTADDKNWSHVVVSSRTATTNGVSSSWSYKYYLQTGLNITYPGYSVRTCRSTCHQGYTWGDQNEGDSADYYNGDFQSFQQVQVINPDSSSQTDTYGATDGWGLANSTIVSGNCAPKIVNSNATCYVASYYANAGSVLATALAGKQQTEQDYDSHGNLMKQTNWAWATNCPPQGVPGSQSAGGGQYDPGPSQLFSELDHSNPVVVCDPRPTQEDSYTTDGVTSNLSDPRVIHTTTATSYDGNNCGSQGYDYGNVSKQDETANDVSGTHIIGTTLFCPNDNIGGGVYLTNLAAQSQTQDSSGTTYGCSQNYFGGNNSVTTAPTLPDVTRNDDYTNYIGGCTGGVVTTLHSYDASGNGITGTDPDNHLGCTSGSNQYTACAIYDSTGTHLISATNAKNQVATYDYDPDAPEAGYGEWLMSNTDINGQTTTYQYDALGRLTAVIKPGDSTSSPTITYSYINTCSAGSTKPCLELDTSTRLTVGGSTMVTEKQWYDGWGNLVETQAPGPNLFSKVPAIGSKLISYTVYDNMDRPTTKSLAYAIAATAGLAYVSPDLTQPRTVTAYDSMGRSLGGVTYSNGSTIVSSSTLSYTIAQGVSTISSESSNTYEQIITLDEYNHQSINYIDGFGRTRYSQLFSGTASLYSVIRTVGKIYDPIGNTLSTETYDSTGTVEASHTASYNGLKQLLGYNDTDLGSCSNTPLPTGCSSSSDLAWKYTYDADGNQLSQEDPRGNTIYMTYDMLDRPLCSALTSADASSCGGSTYAAFFYDGYSNASTPGATFPSACTAPTGSYASDPVGRKTAELFVGTTGAGSGWRCYGFDVRGQADQSTLSVTTPDAGTVTQTMHMTYNDNGQITSLVYPDGETLTSNYTAIGRLQSIYFGTPGSTDPVQFLVGQMTYTNNGQVASLAIGGSAPKASVPTPVLIMSMAYDSVQRQLSTNATVGSQTIWSQTRTYDNAGNVFSLVTTLPTQTGGTATDNEAFCYDALSRMTWAGNSGTPTGGDHCMTAPASTTLPTYSKSYSYDNLDRINSSGAGTYTYGDANQYHAVTSVSSIPNQYATYDAMGNMTCRNVDTTSAHTCAGSTPTGATMTYVPARTIGSLECPEWYCRECPLPLRQLRYPCPD